MHLFSHLLELLTHRICGLITQIMYLSMPIDIDVPSYFYTPRNRIDNDITIAISNIFYHQHRLSICNVKCTYECHSNDSSTRLEPLIVSINKKNFNFFLTLYARTIIPLIANCFSKSVPTQR